MRRRGKRAKMQIANEKCWKMEGGGEERRNKVSERGKIEVKFDVKAEQLQSKKLLPFSIESKHTGTLMCVHGHI